MLDETQFSSSEVETLTEYEPIDRIALAALLTGLLSVVALIHPLLWIVPLGSVVLATIALWRNAVQHRHAGRRLAVTGLALALVFGACATTWTLSVHFMLNRQGQHCCEKWLELLHDGKVYEAHQLCLHFYERLSVSDPIDKIYDERNDSSPVHVMSGKPGTPRMPTLPDAGAALDENPTAGFDAWQSMAPMNTLIHVAPKMHFRFDRRIESMHEGPRQYYARYIYILNYDEGGQSHELPLEIGLARKVVEGKAHWRIVNPSLPSETL